MNNPLNIAAGVMGLLLIGCVVAVMMMGEDEKAAPPNQPSKKDMLNAAHILIQYQGSQRATAAITRTKEEAKTLATEVYELAIRGNTPFSELALLYSDGPSGPKGGDLGNFPPQSMAPQFSQAVMGLEVGKISKPVETEFGFHVIQRKEVK